MHVTYVCICVCEHVCVCMYICITYVYSMYVHVCMRKAMHMCLYWNGLVRCSSWENPLRCYLSTSILSKYRSTNQHNGCLFVCVAI